MAARATPQQSVAQSVLRRITAFYDTEQPAMRPKSVGDRNFTSRNVFHKAQVGIFRGRYRRRIDPTLPFY